MTDPRPLAERVREIAEWRDRAAKLAIYNSRSPDLAREYASEAATLHEAADALEKARKDQP